ncbi:MAG: hypothetical protein K8S21_12905 [Gemmatimonadetes bacterium]|nr:hypothetical protein [Gemmatimonadota bacterium]
MRRTLRLSLGSWLPLRRITTAALFALQAVVAFSPLVERVTPVSRVVHTHDQQRHHSRLHDDATCAICAARTQVAEAAKPPEDLAAAVLPHEAPLTARPAVLLHASRSINASRAPPALS